jgi:P27 family predicted phage terminase small subunit
MGLRGPQPKSTALRILEGRVQHKPLPPNEPQPRIGPPACPRWLDPAAKREWRLIVREWRLAAPRLLTRVDGGVLASYCQALARHAQAEEEISLDLALGVGLDRSKVLTASKYATQVLAFAQQLGLSPASRTRLRLPEPGEVDDGILN